ncbi:MAG: hypothetical protein AABX23_02085 [Nanoarchaeota archaeon]
MRSFGYTLYPEARSKLEISGIAEKIRLKNSGGRLDFGHFFIDDDEIRSVVKEMGDRGLFKTLPPKERSCFQDGIDEVYKNRDKHPWKIKRSGKEYIEQVEIEDILGILGYPASQVLNGDELWDYKKFRFDNLTDLTGSVAALIDETVNEGVLREGYTWQTKRGDGKFVISQITGDTNSDLRIFQTDVTPYETTDPIGNRVSYRPIPESDLNKVIAYHSTEPHLLVALLKWIEHHKLPSQSLKDNYKEVVELARSLGQNMGTATRNYGDFDFPVQRYFTRTDLMSINEDDITKGENIPNHFLNTNWGALYGIYTNVDKELVFVQHPTQKGIETKVTARFLPDEVDHLIKGLFVQAAKGLGRTSANQLMSCLDFRFSKEYEELMRRD